MLDMASALHLQTVAEGVEEPEQMAWLRDRRCDLGQGYLFARPLTPRSLESMLRQPAGEPPGAESTDAHLVQVM